MGWGYKKHWTIGPPGLKRWVHLRQNATQNGLTSRSVKFFFIGWNSTRGWRFDGPGGIYWQQKKSTRKSSGNRQQRRASGDTASRGRGRKSRGAVGALGEWSVTWVSRGARWTAVSAGQAAQGHVDTIAAPGRLAASRRRSFGRSPVVADLSTGTEHRADQVDLPDPTYTHPGLDAAAVTAWRDQLARDRRTAAVRAARHVPLSRWDRLVMRLRGDDPAEWEQKSAATDVALALRRSELAVAAAGGDSTPTRPSPVPGAGVTEGGGTDMANPVRSLTDLTDPDIDPHAYAEELPEHIGAAASTAREAAEQHQQHADRLRAEAAAAAEYAEYMERAEVDSSVLAELRDAAEQLSAASGAAASIAEMYGDAADSFGTAARTAQSVYGEHQPPRFDRAG